MIVVSAEAAVGGDSDDWRQRGSRDGAVHAMRQRRIILDGRGEEKGRGSQDVNRSRSVNTPWIGGPIL